jgi:hypothetical protein
MDKCPSCNADLVLVDPMFLHWVRDEYECPNKCGSWFTDYKWIPTKGVA